MQKNILCYFNSKRNLQDKNHANSQSGKLHLQTLQLHSAKQRHAREWKCYPSVCPKQPSGHQPTGLWSDRFQGKREVVRPGFSLHFWHVKKFESRYPMKWMDFFMAQLPMKNFWAIGKRRKCKDFVTETPLLTIAPHHWSQLHLQEPPAVYQNWYSFHLYFWLSLSFAWCCYHWFSLFSCTSHLENMYLLPP